MWCSDSEGDNAWMLAEVLQRNDNELELALVDKPEVKFTRPLAVSEEGGERKYEGVELANAKLSDEEKAAGMDDDLITLPHLHEPALLHTVGERFMEKKIYTWTGPVLIAVNPFQRYPLYTTVSSVLLSRALLSVRVLLVVVVISDPGRGRGSTDCLVGVARNYEKPDVISTPLPATVDCGCLSTIIITITSSIYTDRWEHCILLPCRHCRSSSSSSLNPIRPVSTLFSFSLFGVDFRTPVSHS